jgi:CheY-like chemotaxis protein
MASAAQDPFDLCILDLRMPLLDGDEVLRRLRQSGLPSAQIPALACSCSVVGGAKQADEAGFDGFLPKPVRKEALFHMLNKLLTTREDSQPERGTEKVRETSQPSIDGHIIRSIRILLAEDNPVNQKLGKIVLQRAGYEVEIANNGREAVNKHRENQGRFDVILMDIQMPEMDGYTATQEIRRLESEQLQVSAKKARVPIVAMTANAMQGDRENCLNAGMDDYIAKPIKRETILEVLKKWVSNEGHV